MVSRYLVVVNHSGCRPQWIRNKLADVLLQLPEYFTDCGFKPVAGLSGVLEAGLDVGVLDVLIGLLWLADEGLAV